MKRAALFTIVIFFSLLCGNIVFSEEPPVAENKEPPAYAGAFFDTQVSLQNYYFIKGVFAVFGNKFGPQPKTPEENESAIWEQLLLSYEAFRRGITAREEEVNEELGKILAAENVNFDREKDRDAYEKWVKDKTGAPSAVFEGQLRHLIQIQKLRKTVMESVDPPVSPQEAYQKFLNEHNNLSVELVQFDELRDAEAFYQKARRRTAFWEEEKKNRPKDFKRPGAVSLEFLMDLWGFDKKASYRMMRLAPGQIHPPAPIYKGFGVFKVLNKSAADRSVYPKVEKGYYEQIRDSKRTQELRKWIEDLKKQANIRIYPQGGKDKYEK